MCSTRSARLELLEELMDLGEVMFERERQNSELAGSRLGYTRLTPKGIESRRARLRDLIERCERQESKTA